MPANKFFSFDGLDGVGKTTQMDLFCRWLADRGHQVVTCRDPGSTELGEQIRRILLTKDKSTRIDGRSEMLLYMAARAQLVADVIRPALEEGKTLVSDRFLLANLVYQGHAGGLDVKTISEIGKFATAGFLPDCTYLLDMPAQLTQGRLNRQLDRIESRGLEYRERVRSGFLKEARQNERTIHVIDATGSIHEIHQQICTIAESLLD